MGNKAELIDILTYHVLPEQVLSTQLQPFQAVKTVEGKPLHVTAFGGRIQVGSSLLSKDLKNVTKADNLASNGVVHIIDGVLLPPPNATAAVAFASTCSLRHDTAMSAQFYKNVTVSQSDCCDLCANDARCRTAVYSPIGECHLHDADDS